MSEPQGRGRRGKVLSTSAELPRVKRIPVQNCREVYGVHTCDKRHPKSWIAENFPLYTFEKGFTEEVSSLVAERESIQVSFLQDELWTSDVRETDEHVNARALSVLQDVWDKYPVDTCGCEQCRFI